MSEGAAELVRFWREVGPERWFKRDDALDAACRDRFGALVDDAARGDLDAWADAAESALALVILTDQLPRNIFRGTPRAFATDHRALATARLAVEAGFDHDVDRLLRQFFYLPFMHAEDRRAQAASLALYRAHGDPTNLHFAEHHHDIVRRFGRFPHRNAVLGRESTPDEIAFLETDDFRG